MTSITEKHTESWSSRLGNSIKGILVGCVVALASVCLLFWNEGRTVKRYCALEEGASNYVAANADNPETANDGKLVYVVGEMKTDETLTDAEFPNISVNAIKLGRKVEMFQWDERVDTSTEKKLGGSSETVKTYSYVKTWSSDAIDSSNFKEPGRDNPALPYSNQEQVASTARLGQYQLSPSLIKMKDDWQKIEVKEGKPVSNAAPAPAENQDHDASSTPRESTSAAMDQNADAAAPNQTEEASAEPETSRQAVGIVSDAPQTDSDIRNQQPTEPRPEEGGYYIGANPRDPQIGDVRITFEYVPNGPVSVVACQQNGALAAYQTETGPIELLETGTVSANKMFSNAQSANSTLGWGLRALGFILMAIGLNKIFAPLSVLADVVPILGRIVGGLTGTAAFLTAGAGSLVTISIAWLYYRPLIAVPLLIAAGVLLILAFMLGQKKKA